MSCKSMQPCLCRTTAGWDVAALASVSNDFCKMPCYRRSAHGLAAGGVYDMAKCRCPCAARTETTCTYALSIDWCHVQLG